MFRPPSFQSSKAGKARPVEAWGFSPTKESAAKRPLGLGFRSLKWRPNNAGRLVTLSGLCKSIDDSSSREIA